MADLRKLVASAIHSRNLADDPTCETPLNRILAFAHVPPLGSSLWRLRYANDHREFQPAVALVARTLGSGARNQLVHRIAYRSLWEWLDDLCQQCLGRGHIVIEGTPHARDVCKKCNGNRLHRYSDQDRIRSAALPPKAYPKWEPVFSKAHTLIASADENAWHTVAYKLERIAGIRGLARRVLCDRPILW